MVGYTAMTAVASGACSIAALGVTLSKKTSFVAWVAAIAAAVAILLNVLLIPRLGITGAALSSLLAQWTSAGLLFALSQRYYFIAYRWRQAFIILLTTALLIGPSARIDTRHMWLTVTLKLGWLSCFPLVMLASGVITTRQLRRLTGRALGCPRKSVTEPCESSSGLLSADGVGNRSLLYDRARFRDTSLKR